MDFIDCDQGINVTANAEDFVDSNCSFTAFKTPRMQADDDQLLDEVETDDSLCRTEPAILVGKSNVLMQLCDSRDISWTSSLATPITGGSTVSWTNLNTEERKVLLPCRDEAPIRRILFNSEDEQSCYKSSVAPPVGPITVDKHGTCEKSLADSSDVLSLPVQSTPRNKQRTNESITLTPTLAQSLSPILGIKKYNELSLPQSTILRRKRKHRFECQLKSTSPISSRSAQLSVGTVDVPGAELLVENMEINFRSSFDPRSYGHSARQNSELSDFKQSTVSLTVDEQSASNSKCVSVPAWPVQECRSERLCSNYEFSTKQHNETNNCTPPYSLKSGFSPLKSSGSSGLSVPAVEPTSYVTGRMNSPILGSGRLRSQSKASLKKARPSTSLPRPECGSQDVERTCKNDVSEVLDCVTPAVPSHKIECIQLSDQTNENSEQFQNSRLDMHPISLSPILGNTNNNYKLSSESRMRRSRLVRKNRVKSSQSTSTAVLLVTNGPAVSNNNEREKVKLKEDGINIDVDSSTVFLVPSGPKTIGTPLVAQEQLANNCVGVRSVNVADTSITNFSPMPVTTHSTTNCPEVMLETQPDGLKISPGSQSINFTQDQQDFSFNTIDEICKVSELIASTGHEDKLGEINSNKLNFVGTVKSTDNKLPKLNTKNAESRVKSIKTNYNSKRNFLYPNARTGVDKLSLPPKLDVKDLCQYARLLEVVANLEPKLSDSKLNNVPNVSAGFVQLSKLKQEDCTDLAFSEKNIMPLARPVENIVPLAQDLEKKELSRTRQTTARCLNEKSNLLKKTLVNKQVHKNVHKKELQIKVPVSKRDIPVPETEFTNTQITCLVKDAELLFQNEDFKWDVKPASSCDNRTPSKRFRSSTYENVDLNKPSVFSNHLIQNPDELIKSNISVENEVPMCNKTQNQLQSIAAVRKICSITDEVVANSGDSFNDIATHTYSLRNSEIAEANNTMASAKRCNTTLSTGKKARTCSSDVIDLLRTTDINTPKANTNKLEGFSTASGKKFNVSDTAVERAKTLFNDIGTSLQGSTGFDTPKGNTNLMQGFSTASGKKLNISEAAVFKARTLFNNIDTSLDTTDFDTPKTSGLQGFSTASGKKFSVSEATLKKAKTLFNDIDSSLGSTGFDTPKANTNFMHGFSTASGKKFNITEEATEKARTLFSEIDTSLGHTDYDTPKPNTNFMQGFSTASGKKCSVTEEAAKKARTLFNDIDISLQGSTGFDTPKPNTNLMQGFSTASGKKCSVTQEAAKKARTLFNDIDISLQGSNGFDTPKANTKLMQGFSTASGKKFSVTEEAAKKARTLFSDIDSSLGRTDFDTPKANTNLMQGFSTASGKKLNISEASVFKARTLFNNIDTSLDTTDFDTPKASGLQGFSTASGKKFSVSEATLKRAKTLFNDIDSSLGSGSFDTPKANTNLMQGFSTASGKKFSVTEEAVKKARALFSDVDMVDRTDCQTPKSQCNMTEGFSTASGKKFSIGLSESSLKKAKNLTSDIEIPTSRTDFKTPKASSLEKNEVQAQMKYACVFATASGKEPDQISESALNDARSIFSDVPIKPFRGFDELHPNQSNNEISYPIVGSGIKYPIGFVSASGKKTNTVSESALSEARGIFGESKRAAPPLESIHTIPSPQTTVPKIQDYPNKFSSSVSQDDMDIAEVLEVTEALLAAEESGVPSWITTFTSSPSHLDDRTDAGKPMVDGVIDRKSPVFGQHDRFRSRKRRPRAKAAVPVVNECTAVFKIPYKQQSGPNAIALPTDRNKKRSSDFEFGTPFAKRHLPAEPPKPVESLQETGLSVEEVGELRIEALENQRLSVAKKDRSLCRPCKGSQLMRKQQERQQTWRQYTTGRPPGKYTRSQLAKYGVREAVINVTAENAAEFQFSANDHYGPSVCRNNTSGVPVSDAAVLILDPEGRAGVDHVELAFLTSPGVDPKLVPEGWVRNHFRWIVWKLAATERSFPQHFAARCLTPTTTLLQLKYRYDKEVDRCQRPAIRRVMEQDDPASRRMVLCVSRVERAQGDHHGFRLELTDGWYSVMGSLDADLSRFVAKGLVCVGTKLMIHGAELVNCKEACYPLEASSDVCLKLNANATRRARWDTRLGFQANPGPLKLGLDTVLPSGGSVGRVDVHVARVYPTLYVETVEDGRKVTRSGVAESRAAALYDRRHQERIEVLYAKARAELCLEQDASKKASGGAKGRARKLGKSPSGSQLELMVEQSADIGGVQELLSSDQLTEVMKHRQQSSEALLRDLEDRVKQKLVDEGGKRNVASLLKIRVMAVNGSTSSTAILSVWRAPEDFTTMLREGTTVSIRGVATSGFRAGNLQLTAGRQTRYQTLSVPNKTDHLVRSVTCLEDVSDRDFWPLFGELDVVGVVVHISSTSNFHTVYLAGQQMALLGVAFWGGLKDSGFEDLLKPGAVIAATNLQWRKGSSTQRIPCAYVFELTTFSRNPRQHYLQEALKNINQVVLKNLESFVKSSSEKLSALLHDALPPSSSNHWSPGVPSTTNHPSSVRQSAENLAEPPQDNSLDCKELSPAQRRLIRLSCYSDPPPLPPMCISASTKIGEYRAPNISIETIPVEETTVDTETDSLPLSLE